MDKQERNIYIRKLLNDKKITIKKLSQIMGISTTTINRKISGSRKFNERDINFICDILDMTYEEVFRRTN